MTGLQRPAPTQAGTKSSQLRRFIVLMLFITVVINYVDRSSLSIAAPHIVEELGLSSSHYVQVSTGKLQPIRNYI